MLRRFLEVERSFLTGLNLVRRSLKHDGALLFKAFKVRRVLESLSISYFVWTML